MVAAKARAQARDLNEDMVGEKSKEDLVLSYSLPTISNESKNSKKGKKSPPSFIDLTKAIEAGKAAAQYEADKA